MFVELNHALRQIPHKGGLSGHGFRFSDSEAVVFAFADLDRMYVDIASLEGVIEKAPYALQNKQNYYTTVQQCHDIILAPPGDSRAILDSSERLGYITQLLEYVPSFALASGVRLDKVFQGQEVSLKCACSLIRVKLEDECKSNPTLTFKGGVYTNEAFGIYDAVHMGIADVLGMLPPNYNEAMEIIKSGNLARRYGITYIAPKKEDLGKTK